MIIQLILLCIWTFTQKGIINKEKTLINGIKYNYETCSRGNEAILSIIFSVDYILLLVSIIISYKGRKSNIYLI